MYLVVCFLLAHVFVPAYLIGRLNLRVIRMLSGKGDNSVELGKLSNVDWFRSLEFSFVRSSDRPLPLSKFR